MKSQNNKPLILNDVPLLRHFFLRSTWRDLSVKQFILFMATPFFYKRIALSIKDAQLNGKFGQIMGRYSKSHQPFYYLYVGANDGVIGDTIMPYALKYKWHGVLIEPVPHIMKTLKNNFGSLKNTEFEQVAIDTKVGERKLFIVKESDSPQPIFAHIIPSFSEAIIKKQKISWGVDKESDVVPIKVQTTTIKDLLEKYRISRPGLIAIDIEGYDYTIVKHMLSHKIHPIFLKFEHHNMNNIEQKELRDMLTNLGYEVKRMRGDYFCYIKSEIER